MVEEKLKEFEKEDFIGIGKNKRDVESGQTMEKKNVELGNSSVALGGSMDFKDV